MKLINSDFLTLDLSVNSVDLIITSPPYNIGINYSGTNDCLPYKDYLDFSLSWLVKCFTLLKENGRLCINVPLDTKDRSISVDLTILAKKAGYRLAQGILPPATKENHAKMEEN